MAKKEAKDLKYGISKTDNVSAYNTAQAKNTYYKPSIYINKITHPEIVELLKSKPSISEYIVSLILADMTKEKR